MDFITGFPKAQGKDEIFVVVYCLTKFVHFFHIHGVQCISGSRNVLQRSF
jgi:hypothetical protein